MVKNIKVSPSLLDAFDNYLTGKYNETEERLLDKINKKAQYQETEAMHMGTAFHHITRIGAGNCQVIRDKKSGDQCYRFEFWDFKKGVVDEVVDLRKGLFHEQYVSRYIETNCSPVLLYGYVDDIGNRIIQDVKTTKQYRGGISYYDAWQWKVYLYCANSDVFNYIITDYTNVYPEQYHNSPYIKEALKSHVNRYCEFINDNKEKIDLTLVTT